MSAIAIADLTHSHELDAKTMSSVRGGTNSWLAGLGPVANVNVGVKQDLNQEQNVKVNVLNNIGSIGPDFGPLHLDVNPAQWADANVKV
jgi:hypothetical protein